MKKYMVLFLVLILSLTVLNACGEAGGEAAEAITNSGLASAELTQVTSLEDLMEQMDFATICPTGVEIADEVFGILKSDTSIAEYSFSCNGTPCYLRFSKSGKEVDISGLTDEDGNSLFISGSSEDEDGAFEPSTQFISNDTLMAQRWFTADGQFVFVAKDGQEWEWEDFELVCNQMMKVEPKNWTSDVPYADYSNIQGYYMDESHIAALIIDGTSMDIYIYAEEEDSAKEWIIEDAVLDGTKLVYDKEMIYTFTGIDEEESLSSTDYAEAGAGYLEISDGILSCAGAASEDLHDLTLPSILLI